MRTASRTGWRRGISSTAASGSRTQAQSGVPAGCRRRNDAVWAFRRRFFDARAPWRTRHERIPQAPLNPFLVREPRPNSDHFRAQITETDQALLKEALAHRPQEREMILRTLQRQNFLHGPAGLPAAAGESAEVLPAALTRQLELPGLRIATALRLWLVCLQSPVRQDAHPAPGREQDHQRGVSGALGTADVDRPRDRRLGIQRSPVSGSSCPAHRCWRGRRSSAESAFLRTSSWRRRQFRPPAPDASRAAGPRARGRATRSRCVPGRRENGGATGSGSSARCRPRA